MNWKIDNWIEVRLMIICIFYCSENNILRGHLRTVRICFGISSCKLCACKFWQCSSSVWVCWSNLWDVFPQPYCRGGIMNQFYSRLWCTLCGQLRGGSVCETVCISRSYWVSIHLKLLMSTYFLRSTHPHPWSCLPRVRSSRRLRLHRRESDRVN